MILRAGKVIFRGPPKTDKGDKMGQHSAKPPKLTERARRRAKRTETFCIHFIVEGMAGLAAIIVYEVFRAEYLNEPHTTAIGMFIPF